MSFLYLDVIYFMLIPLSFLIYLIFTNKSTLERVFESDILSKLTVNTKTLSKKFRNTLFFISIILMILALARPVILKDEIEIKSKGIDVVLALDISKSMLADDVYPNRITFAKDKLRSFVKLSQNVKLSIIAFANQSFIVSALTNDIDTTLFLLDNLNIDSLSSVGTSLIAPLKTADMLLKDSKDKIVVIFSDGGDESDFSQAIAFAKAKGIKIYVVGIGSEKGSVIKENGEIIKDEAGNIVVSKLNEAIKSLALESDGAYIKSTISSGDVEQIYQDIRAKSELKEYSSNTIKDYQELFYYPLALAVVILMFAFSSFPRVLLLFFVFVSFGNLELKASILDFYTIDKANQSYQDGNFSESSRYFRELIESKKSSESYYNFANSLYKDGKYKEALEYYQKVITQDSELEAKKLYNMGNSEFKLNELEKAKEFYEKSLKLKDDEDIKYNLKVIEEILKNRQDSNESQTQENQQQNKDSNESQTQENQQQNEDSNESQTQENQQQNKDSNESQTQENQQQKEDSNESQTQENQQQKDDSNESQNEDSNQSEEEQKEEMNSQNMEQNSSQEDLNESIQKAMSGNLDEVNGSLSDIEEQKWFNILQNPKTLIYKNENSKDEDVKNRW